MMLPTVLASMLVKPVGTRLIQRWGYRRTLVVNTGLLAVMIASFALITPEQPFWLRVAQLLVFGASNSMQFMGMNSVTLKDLEAEYASSGNSLLSMVQMLAMGMGVAIAGAVLAGFHALWGQAGTAGSLPAFQATFICMGVMTLFSASIFTRLDPLLPRAR